LPDWVRLAASGAARLPQRVAAIRLDEFLADIEREVLARALKAAQGNKSKAAELVGLSRPRLLRRLAQLGLAAPPMLEEPVVFEPLPEDS
jgi:DNA-binding NtrC family response regulator